MVVPVLVGAVAAGLSLLRLWWGDHAALVNVLWAEDGLFPLCIQKAGFLECLNQPFAGYFLFLPRAMAWPVSMFPWEHWALVANLLAAVLLGVVSALAVAILRRAGMGYFVAIAVALLPALAPMVGLEAINALGSSYILLLFLATLAVAFPPIREGGAGQTIGLALLLLLTALTIPSAVVLIPLLLVVGLRGAMRWRDALVGVLALLTGVGVQTFVALTAQTPRSVDLSSETLNSWADAVPTTIFTYWPGLSLGQYEFFTNFTLSPLAVTGWLMVVLIAVLGLVLVIRGDGRIVGVGVLLLSGLGMGLIPSAIGFANNRYFVVPALLWGAAVLVALDPIIRRSKPWIVGLVSALVLVIWWPAFPASWFRSTPAPRWTEEVANIEAKCKAEPDFVARPLFTPYWPPNWGDGLDEPTHPNFPCMLVYRWID